MAARYVKVPVVLQMEALECGAASLAMILAYYGKWLPLEQVREDCGVSRDGSKAKNILTAARNYGLEAKGARGSVDDVKKAAFPCIIHWNNNHFLVVRGFSDKYAYLNDPSSGEMRVSMPVFTDSFTGVYMVFKKTKAFVPEGKPRSLIRFAQTRLKGAVFPFIFVSLTGLLSALLGVMNPLLSRVLIDRVLSGFNPEWLTPIILVLASAAAASLIITGISERYLSKIRGKLAIVASASFLWHVLRLPVSFFSQRLPGDLESRQSANERIAETLIVQFAPLLIHFVSMLFYLAFMLHYSPLLTAMGMLSLMLNLVAAAVIARKRMDIMRVQTRDASRLSILTTSGIEMIESIKATGGENAFFHQWSGTQAAINTAGVRYGKTALLLGIVPEITSALASIAILITGVFLIADGRLTVGMLFAFQGFLAAFALPVKRFVSASDSTQVMRAAMERIEDVMNNKPDVASEPVPQVADTEDLDKLRGDVSLKHITFGYSKLEPPLIKDFSLKLEAGQSIALVGSSGCGKSTVAKILTGLYKPWSGEINFDGKPRAEWDRRILTSSIAVVDQDIVIFDDSISANIKLWDESIEDYESVIACKEAGIHQTILLRPEGYQHRLIDNGKNFSGGERQRLEIARALASNPTILILDEATSALDAKTEFEVVKAIKDRGITCLIIAHRLSTIRDCDEIIVMDKGEIVERGTHDTLFEQGGFYTRLVTQ